jgi:hypothetical protein
MFLLYIMIYCMINKVENGVLCDKAYILYKGVPYL